METPRFGHSHTSQIRVLNSLCHGSSEWESLNFHLYYWCLISFFHCLADCLWFRQPGLSICQFASYSISFRFYWYLKKLERRLRISQLAISMMLQRVIKPQSSSGGCHSNRVVPTWLILQETRSTTDRNSLIEGFAQVALWSIFLEQ